MNIQSYATRLEALGASNPAEWVRLLGRKREPDAQALAAETISDWLYGYGCAAGGEVAALIEEIRWEIEEVNNEQT